MALTHSTYRHFAVAAAMVVSAGCPSIQIREPVQGATVPTPVKVTITGSSAYSNLRVSANGSSVASQLPAQAPDRNEGFVALSPGPATIDASADFGNRTSTAQVAFTVSSARALVDISAGGTHTCAVDAGGAAFCWGDNSHGQLGTGGAPDLSCGIRPGAPARPCRPNPAAVAGGLAFRRASAGGAHTCALTTAGEAWCWGRNDRGQLGDGSRTDSRVPVKVIHPRPFEAVSAGGAHTCAIDDQHWLYCWGDNGAGQAGFLGTAACPTGATDSCATPVRQGTGIAGASFSFFEVSAGDRHTCASNLASVKCWGDNTQGQLGKGTMGPASGGPDATISVSGQYKSYATPPPTNLGPGVAAGGAHACALRAQGSGAACWGDNHSGQLGGSWPNPSSGSPLPASASGGQLVNGIAAGAYHGCGLLAPSAGASNHVPACAGFNLHGQVGDGSRNDSRIFAPVRGSAASLDFFKVTAGGQHSCALSVLGRASSAAGGTDFFGLAFCWGDNSYGQVGQSYDAEWLTPWEVHFP